jgi:3-dehydroquinate synthase
MHLIKATMNNSSCSVYIGNEILSESELLAETFKTSRLIFVCDEIIAKLYLSQILAALPNNSIDLLMIPAKEENKSWDSVMLILKTLSENRHDRYSTIVSLGGGVIGDLTGFAASVYMRGINWVQMPTTLLAQVDASIGGKTGCNFFGIKNLIGTFYQPTSVIIDIALLKSLQQREYLAGLAEVVKYGMACDAEFFVWLEEHHIALKNRDSNILQQAIRRSCEIKLKMVEADETDKGLRRSLNFGHTFAHALEAATNFKRYLHGEAVAIGMLLATRLAVKLAMVDNLLLERLKVLLSNLGLSFELETVNCSTDVLFNFMKSDKKSNAEQLCLILPCALGQVRVLYGFDLETLEDLIKDHAVST